MAGVSQTSVGLGVLAADLQQGLLHQMTFTRAPLPSSVERERKEVSVKVVGDTGKDEDAEGPGHLDGF